jgi:fructose-1,6-bisphosphatase/inositol monophosphatase family enzyme
MPFDPRSTIHDPRFTTLAHALADAAGDIIRPLFGAHGEVETKFDKTPVTEADKKAEEAMRALIRAEFPEHGIFGEEMGREIGIGDWGLGIGEKSAPPQSLIPNPQSRFTWLLDPIDGTRAFIEGRKEWGTLIALCENDVPILGLLDQPVTGERWLGARGEATQYDVRSGIGDWGLGIREKSAPPQSPIPNPQSRLVQTRACTLANAELSTTSANYFKPGQAKQIIELAKHVRRTVKDGDCYAYGLLARGERDLVVDAGLKPYDILALAPIIEGAGGIITGWDGAPLTLNHYAHVLAAGSAELHKEALAFLSSA